VLHEILNYVKDQSKFVDPAEKQAYLTERENLFIDRALEHLEKEGYLKRETTKNGNNTSHRFFITYAGLMFIAEGGYNHKFKLNRRNERFKRTLNTSNLVTPILTFFIALLALLRTFAGCDKQVIEVIHTDEKIPTRLTIKTQRQLSAKDSLTKNQSTFHQKNVADSAKR
jgi:hypothetical protein